MPLWLVFHPPEAFITDEAKQALSKDITEVYTFRGLPAFYVDVIFIVLPRSDIFVGGKPKADKPFIRISIDNIAVHTEGVAEAQKSLTSRIDAALKPHIAAKGYDWEYHIAETDRGLWKINGLIPPPFGSDAEAVWARENAPVEWEGGRG